MPACPVPPCPVPNAPLPGTLSVQLLSGGKVVATRTLPPGDQPRKQVVWAGGHDLAKGAKMQLRFELSGGAKLYS
jgi:hypothetical protein